MNTPAVQKIIPSFLVILFFICYQSSTFAQQKIVNDPAPQKVPPSVVQKHKQLLHEIQSNASYELEGIASYYADQFHGKKTANGEVFDMHQLTAAHKSLPFNTIVEVTNNSNAKTVTVRINDRGPYLKKRIIDLSLGAAQQVGMIQSGTAPVKLKILKLGNPAAIKTQRSARYTHLQVASFSQKGSAENLVKTLHNKGLKSHLESFNQYYRVFVKNEKGKQKKIEEILLSMGINDHWYVEKK